jgi:hypothetical protein
VSRHPVVVAVSFEAIGKASIGEEMEEEQPVVGQPPVDARELALPVPHILEHLDGQDAVETLHRFKAIVVDRQYVDVAETALFGPGLDEATL